MPVLQPEKTKPQKKPQARGFNPHAMAQAQALNQQPDSIPAMMKPGEYVLPPDTVAAMGGPQALDATVAQTHIPANAGAIVPKGFEPRLFFNNGGLVEDEEQNPKPISPTPDTAPGGQPAASRGSSPAAPATPSPIPAQTPRAQFVADQNAKLAAANAKLAERTQQMNARYQPAPNGSTNTFPGNRLPVENGQPQQAAPAQPSRGAVGFLADAFPGTTAAVQGSMDDAKEAYRQGGFGAALGQSARVAATPLIGLADDVYSSAAKVVRPVTDTALQAGKTFLTGDASSIAPAQQGVAAGPGTTARQSTAGGASAAPERTPEQLANQLGGLDRQHAQNVQLQAAARTPEQARAEVQQTEGLAQLRGLPGVYQHGKGQYSDNPEGMGFATGFTGQPSVQNMQAANALASQQQAQSTARVQAAQQQAQQQAMQPRGFAPPQIDHSGNSSASKDELRRLRWAAESAMENAPRKKYAMQHPAVLAYQAALQGDTAARYGGQAGLEAKTNDTNAGLQREQMQQQGANQRDAGRLAIDQQRMGIEATSKGFDVRQAQRKQSFQEAWAKGTKEQREQLQQMYPDLFGNEDNKKPYSFDVVPGSVDPMTGKREGDYAVVVDPNTGQYRQVQIGQ